MMWEQIHPEIIKASKEIAQTGKFDDAIFAAFRVVEATIQERISSKSIGEALVADALDGTAPRINISSDARDQQGIRDLFSGALRNIRNDRGHKRAPFTPCESLESCVLYLSLASLLLHLLTKDKNTFPRIDGLRVYGTAEHPRAELRGINFAGSHVAAIAGTEQVSVVRNAPTVLEILLPESFSGNIAVRVDGKLSGEVFCDASSLGKQPDSYYEVIAAELPLYSDLKASQKRPDVVGLLLRATEISREFINIFPTRTNRYKAGQYVSHGPTEPTNVIGETWYIDPSTGRTEYAWTGSLVFAPNVVGVVGTFKLGGISVLPRSVQTQVGENRCLHVSGWGRNGPAQQERDVTNQVEWTNIESSVAFVNKGIVVPKKLGRANAECKYQGFVASVEISVEHILRGQRTTYFQGLKRLQQIRFDNDDSLYICNQGPSVFRLDKTGSFQEVVRISTSARAASGVDCLALDADKNLYVNDISKSAAFRFEWDGKTYANPIEIAHIASGAKKGIVVADSGDVFIAVMGPVQGWIVRRDGRGNETSFPVSETPLWLAVGPGGNLYMPVTARSSIFVYRPDGALIDQIPYQVANSSVSDILIDKNGVIYLAFFQSGRILRINHTGSLWHADFLPQTFGTPGGIAMDSRGRLYVSDFVTNSIEVIY
jgi:streptogramin lyase